MILGDLDLVLEVWGDLLVVWGELWNIRWILDCKGSKLLGSLPVDYWDFRLGMLSGYFVLLWVDCGNWCFFFFLRGDEEVYNNQVGKRIVLLFL